MQKKCKNFAAEPAAADDRVKFAFEKRNKKDTNLLLCGETVGSLSPRRQSDARLSFQWTCSPSLFDFEQSKLDQLPAQVRWRRMSSSRSARSEEDGIGKINSLNDAWAAHFFTLSTIAHTLEARLVEE